VTLSACMQELASSAIDDQLCAGQCSEAQIAALQEAASRMPTRSGKSQGAQLIDEYRVATVYGSYAAVQLADAVMLQRLVSPMAPLLSSFETQSVRFCRLRGCLRRTCV
jgi:hypothetical protein